MIYVTGDKHGDFRSVFSFCQKYNTSQKDILIILGDAGINYYLDKNDYELKDELKSLPITLFCIHGNHEERPENIKSYKTKKFHDGIVYFAKDAEIYNFNGKRTLVIGGAYSVDKDYRLLMGYNWFQSEQPSQETKEKIKNIIENKNNKIDIILSHTCPYKYLPYEAFLSFIDQSNVDKSTELFLNYLEENTNYKKWYLGHYHINKRIDKIVFLFDDFMSL